MLKKILNFNKSLKQIQQTSKTVYHTIESSIATLEDTLASNVYKIAITGMSRSGKSMLFTSLIAQLSQREKGAFSGLHSLPLLKSIPIDEVEHFELRSISAEKVFPFEACFAALKNQSWPPPTEELYGFELVLTFKKQGFIKNLINRKKNVIFRFYDYPGEWLTDLPMLSMDYTNWCYQVTAQLNTNPQKALATDWHHTLENFDFDQPPNTSTIRILTEAYRDYLQRAKQAGISMRQPAGFLLSTTQFDWEKQGFVPLPAKVLCDYQHPWYLAMNDRYIYYQTDWLQNIKEKYFTGFDRQIILVDLLEGLNHGKVHLGQLKEAVSNLAELFIQGQSWWQKLMRLNQINKVAFVATKADLIPACHQTKLLSLLKDVTAGARSKFKGKQTIFEHFIVSAIQVTIPDPSHPKQLLYLDENQETREFTMPEFPENFREMKPEDRYPTPKPIPAKHFQQQILSSQNLDTLMEYMICGAKEDE